MSWLDDYDNAERGMFYTMDNKLANGKDVMSFVRGFCSTFIAGKSYIETMPTPVTVFNNTGDTGGIDEGITVEPVNKFLSLKLTETGNPRSYNPSDEVIPLFSKHEGV